MYNVYTTPGFIIDSRNYGEAGKILYIFTRDFGLIQAIAQGIRLEKSKLRYFVREHSSGIFSVIRGKEYWRLTNAQEAGRQELGAWSTGKGSREIMAKISLLLRRLLHGEEANMSLFDYLAALKQYLDKPEWKYESNSFDALESLTVIRILHSLGYVDSDHVLGFCFQSRSINSDLLSEVSSKRVIINQHINKALRESHL